MDPVGFLVLIVVLATIFTELAVFVVVMTIWSHREERRSQERARQEADHGWS